MRMSPTQIASLDEALKRRPSAQKKRELIVQRARAEGGLTLTFWKLFKGPWFGEPTMLSLEECATELKIPVSELIKLGDRTMDSIRTELENSPEWKASRQGYGGSS